MSAITISRQLGSHGARIARGLARELGWKFADKATINKVIKQYGLVHLDSLYGEKPPSFWELFQQDSVWTIEWMNKTIQTIAAQGDVVILGRGGFAVLGGYADCFDVFIKAPLEVRARRIGLRDDITPEDAEKKVLKDDATRRRFTKRIYGVDWADDANFDFVLDTADLSDDKAIQLIIEGYQAQQDAPIEGPRIDSIELDPLLAETIQEVLG